MKKQIVKVKFYQHLNQRNQRM